MDRKIAIPECESRLVLPPYYRNRCVTQSTWKSFLTVARPVRHARASRRFLKNSVPTAGLLDERGWPCSSKGVCVCVWLLPTRDQDVPNTQLICDR
jgi:hypothetical protein